MEHVWHYKLPISRTVLDFIESRLKNNTMINSSLVNQLASPPKKEREKKRRSEFGWSNHYGGGHNGKLTKTKGDDFFKK